MPSVTNLKEKQEEKRPPRGEGAPKPPPSKPREKASTTGDGKRRTPNDRKLGEAVQGLYEVLGASVVGVGLRLNDQGLAGAGVKTIELAEPVSEAWLDLADKNPKVKQTLLKLTEVSAVGVLVGMHLSIALPLLIDRGVIPESMAAYANGAQAETNGNGSHSAN